MNIVWALCRKELELYFLSPLAYAFLGGCGFLAGLFFYLGLGVSPEPNIRIMTINLSLSLLFVMPLLTMRQFSEEQRRGTFEMLMTFPISSWSIVVGKWLATVLLCILLLGCTLLFPVILTYFASPDWGAIMGAYVGLLLCSMSFISAGLFASSLTDEPVTAGMGGILILVPFWLSGVLADFVEVGTLQNLLQDMSFVQHLDACSKGLLDATDITWFILFVLFFLLLTWHSVESRRWR